jgi:hypothetical protein
VLFPWCTHSQEVSVFLLDAACQPDLRNIVLQDDDSDEIDDFTIRDSDLLLLTARNEDDVSNIEVRDPSDLFLIRSLLTIKTP